MNSAISARKINGRWVKECTPPKLTVEQRLARLEKEVFNNESIFYSSPLCERHAYLLMQVMKLADYLGIHWRPSTTYPTPEGWELKQKPWWRW